MLLLRSSLEISLSKQHASTRDCVVTVDVSEYFQEFNGLQRQICVIKKHIKKSLRLMLFTEVANYFR